MYINLYLYSKNKNSLHSFLKFFKKLYFSKNLKTLLFIKYFQKQKISKVFTVLKSPHVNKKAQEQFEYRLYSKQVTIYSLQILKLLIIFKKVQAKNFPDINIQIKFLIFNKNILKTRTQIFNPDRFLLRFFKTDSYDYKRKTQTYLKLIDRYGEIKFKNII